MPRKTKTNSVSLEEALKRINLAALLATAAGEEELFSLIVATAAQIARAERSLLFVYDAKASELRLRACYPQEQAMHGLSIAPGKGIVGNVFLSGQPLIMADLATNPDIGASVGGLLHDSEVAEHIRVDDVIAVPVVAGETSMGVLEIVNKRGEGAFEQRDSDMVCAFAKIVAISLQDNQTDRDVSRVLAEALKGSGVLDNVSEQALSKIDKDPTLRRALVAANLLRDIQFVGDRHLTFCEEFLASYLEHIKKARRPSA